MSMSRYSMATSHSSCDMVISFLIPILFIVLMVKETGSLHNRPLNRCAINVTERRVHSIFILKYFHEATSNKFKETNLLDIVWPGLVEGTNSGLAYSQ